jgi:glycosyltransferase involved in cell wall biosynthesis
VELDDVGHTEQGSPVLVDFAGLDPRRPWSFVPPGDRVVLGSGESPGLKMLCETQAAALLDAGVTEVEPFSVSSGIPGLGITTELRRWYRTLLAEATSSSASAVELPPNPYVPGEIAAFIDLLASPGASAHSGMGVHVDQVLVRRGDLAAAFPHPRWRDRRAFTGWAWSHGLAEGETSLLTLPGPPAPTSLTGDVDTRRPFGVNLVGYLGAELGLGVAARRMRSALNASGVPTAEVNYDRTSSRQRPGSQGVVTTPYEFNLLLITPDQLPLFVADVGAEFLAGHHNIGLWYWESDVTAPSQAAAFDLVDEIWVATTYLTRAFGGHGTPVRVVPSPLVFDAPPPQLCSREHHGLDDSFTFLFSFDFLSVSERKNPLGLIEAYTQAFPVADGGTRLLLKSINGPLFPDELAHLRWVAASRPDITVRDEMLDAPDRLGLVAAVDCYISLHRSEGLGLTMAEAMSLGTPVIATGYSGNMDFMPDGSVLVVPAREETVGPGHYYPAHGHWASPDLDAAAAHMRRVVDDEDLRHRLAVAGRSALEKFSYEAVGEIAASALLQAWKQR